MSKWRWISRLPHTGEVTGSPAPPLPSSLNHFSPFFFCRKLLEGEETRIGTGIAFPGPTMSAIGGQGYSYQSRIYTSSGKSSKKEGKEEEQNKAGSKVSQREVFEETVLTTKKMEKQQEDVPISQKN